MIVTVANAKGGVAKTTTAVYLCAAHGLAVDDMDGALLLDADVQASASLWRDMADEHGDPLGFDVCPANLSTLRRLRGSSAARLHGLAVVDAPPQGPVLEAAVRCADFVVVPASDSPLDLQQAWATMAAIPQGVPKAVLVVRAEPRTTACMETIAALDGEGTPRFDAVVRKRQDIKRCMGARPVKLWEYARAYREILEVAR
ncbi:ParA family protein [Bifidobacterium tsurumiense]|uniref:ParA family protein n=1 Tax=Bifidobacterium tsurumiense TaxID=356829 RepID=UPI000479E1E9|nr:ParA family protein [Bifidobacterium tsurumiense]